MNEKSDTIKKFKHGLARTETNVGQTKKCHLTCWRQNSARISQRTKLLGEISFPSPKPKSKTTVQLTSTQRAAGQAHAASQTSGKDNAMML